MPIAIPIAIGVSAAAGIGSAAIGAHAAGNAANQQANAATYAADLQKKSADEALAFQKQQWQTQQDNSRPWVNAGQMAASTLSGMMPELTQPWNEQFHAPTAVTEQNDPGFQFRLSEGTKALERSAAARGGVLSGGTAKAMQRYGQDYSSNEYNNVYNRSFGEYSNRYNVFKANQGDAYNKYAGLAGLGQTATSQLNAQGGQTANNVSNILMGSANQIGQDYQNAAAARGSGYVGAANAWGGAMNNIAGMPMQYLMLQQLMGGGKAPAAPSTYSIPSVSGTVPWNIYQGGGVAYGG